MANKIPTDQLVRIAWGKARQHAQKVDPERNAHMPTEPPGEIEAVLHAFDHMLQQRLSELRR